MKKEITSQDKLSACCKAKTHSTVGKYQNKYYCTKCDMRCGIYYADWEKKFLDTFCYLDGDGDEYDSWEAYFMLENASPYEILKFINSLKV